MTNGTETPKRPSTATPEAEYVSFVYAGRRQGTKGMVDATIPLGKNDSLGKERYFKADRAERIVGGVYTGAWFDVTQVWGLGAARYDRRWPNKPDILRWEAEHEHAKATARREKLEQDAKRKSFIDDEMLELRLLYTDMRKRGDYAGCTALEDAVALSLRRKAEKN